MCALLFSSSIQLWIWVCFANTKLKAKDRYMLFVSLFCFCYPLFCLNLLFVFFLSDSFVRSTPPASSYQSERIIIRCLLHQRHKSAYILLYHSIFRLATLSSQSVILKENQSREASQRANHA